jgi:peptidoglycan/LPS O-acetylase OafA/YrhL
VVGKLSDRHIPELDGLRAIAAIAILLFHANIPLFADAWVGVPIFFVLSGFLVTGILLDSLEAKNFYSAFYIRRGLRIFPIYYLLLLIIAIPYALLIRPDRELALYALYLQNIQLGITNFSGTFVHGVLNHTWSLAIETQFYLIWPFLVKALRLKGILILCPILVILSIGLRLIFMALDLRTLSWTLLPTCLDTLCIGAFLAALIRTNLIHQYQSWLRLVAPSLVALIIGGYWLLVRLLFLTPVWAPGQLHPSTFSGSLFLSLLGPLIGIIALIIISGWAPFLRFFLCTPPCYISLKSAMACICITIRSI